MSPDGKKKILISDKMSDEGVKILQSSNDFDVVYNPDISHEELIEQIGQYSALVIRSRTTVDKAVLENAAKLEVIGRAGVGVDNVDVPEATARGVVVMNTPDGNTLSTAEHTFTLILSMARRIAFADRTMKEGQWAKKQITGVELSGKTLGVCGLGRIGREVAKRARAFDMKVVGFDPYFSKEGAERLGIELKDNIDAVVEVADVITVHTPLNKDTKGMIGKEQIDQAKKGVMIVNCARGGIIDEKALVDGLNSGKVAAAALDVFEEEPLAEDHPFRKIETMTLTPHLAASTSEAQESVARDVALQIIDALKGVVVRNAVNAPSVDAETLKQIRPYLGLAEKTGRFASQYVPGSIKRLEITYSGAIAKYPTDPITIAAVKGFLEPHTSEPVNYVNAMNRAEARGMDVHDTRTSETGDYTSLLTLKVKLEDGTDRLVSGALFGQTQTRIVQLDGLATEVDPTGRIILIENEDKPGVIGAAAVLLGERGINIAEMDLERLAPGKHALTFIQIDGEVDDKTLDELRGLPHIIDVRVLEC